jgi:hypothetical protein
MKNLRTRPNTLGCDSKPSCSSKNGHCGGKQRTRQVRSVAKPTQPKQSAIAYTSRRLPAAELFQIRSSRQLDSPAQHGRRTKNDQDGRALLDNVGHEAARRNTKSYSGGKFPSPAIKPTGASTTGPTQRVARTPARIDMLSFRDVHPATPSNRAV